MSQTDKVDKLQAWREDFDKNSKHVVTTFSTTSGEQVLKLLKKHFGSDTVFNENPVVMARNAGRNEVVSYLEALIERGRKI